MHTTFKGSTLNSLRAAVLGANDGIISLAALLLGIAAATDSRAAIATAGVAGLLAGAFSMAAGEYVSVSTQRDTEKALLAFERKELEDNPKKELAELEDIYIMKGLSADVAKQVAAQLTEKGAFQAHVDAELNMDPEALTSPWQAALASAAAFVAGALVPLVCVLLAPEALRIVITAVAVVIALLITGYLSAIASRTQKLQAMVRVLVGGVLAMLVTYYIGRFFRGI